MSQIFFSLVGVKVSVIVSWIGTEETGGRGRPVALVEVLSVIGTMVPLTLAVKA